MIGWIKRWWARRKERAFRRRALRIAVYLNQALPKAGNHAYARMIGWRDTRNVCLCAGFSSIRDDEVEQWLWRMHMRGWVEAATTGEGARPMWRLTEAGREEFFPTAVDRDYEPRRRAAEDERAARGPQPPPPPRDFTDYTPGGWKN